VALGDAVLSTQPGRVETKVQRRKVPLHSPQPGGSWSDGGTFPSMVRTNVENCRDCAAEVLCAVSSGDMTNVVQSGVTNYVCS